jgi:prophage antirepressor-like protein
MKFKFSEMYKIKMNALIDLTKCREYLTINIGGRDQQVRLCGTITDPYFCGRDVCEVLGYKNPKKALLTHIKTKHKKELVEMVGPTVGPTYLGSLKPLTYNEGKAVYINEPGLYSLIMNSDAPFAEEFQDMVYETILPSIRKYGSYQVENQLSVAMEKLAIKEKSEEELQERLEHAKQEAEEYKQYALTLKDLAISDQKRPLNDVIYISTSRAYAGHNRYKVGGVEGMEKLKPRFSGYNGRSSVDDEWYYSDIFKVANFRAAEKRIEDVLGRFRERKNKEIYVLHYSDLRRYVEWICEHYEDEIEEFNKELDVLISNLNKHKLRPIIPPPYQGTSATITRIVDGVPSSITIESTIEEQFKHKIKVYLDTLEPTTKEVKRTELFEQVPFNFNRIDGWRWLKEVIPKFKPELNLKYR